MLAQIEAFQRGRAELGKEGDALTLSLSRVAYVVNSDSDRRAKTAIAHDYYSRFDNVYTGPGIVKHGAIAPLPRQQSLQELGENLLICTPSEMVDQLGPYMEAGVDRFVLNINFGAEQSETLESIQCFAEEVMPHFSQSRASDVPVKQAV